MNEMQLNNFLLQTRFLAEKYYTKGDKSSGDLILQCGSEVAKQWLPFIKRTKFSCPNCKHIVTNAIEQDFIKLEGWCLTCEGNSVYAQDAYENVI